MTRQERIAKHFQKKHLLTVSNKVYREQLLSLFDWMVVSDQVNDDITTKVLGVPGKGVAEIICKQTGIIAGVEEAIYCLKQKTQIVILDVIVDGSFAKKGDVIIRMTGDVKDLLGFERIILNMLGRMSGIATYTQSFVSVLQGVDNEPLLVSTRKTPWMLLDKKAVCVGGGGTHRLSLSDFVLAKDTHLFENTLQDAVGAIVKTGNFFEIEVSNIKQADMVISTLMGAKYKEAAIMLDNFTPKAVLEFMQRFKSHSFYDHVYVEASGEITKENLLEWLKTRVDIISIGRLTHSAPTFNLSMRLKGLAL